MKVKLVNGTLSKSIGVNENGETEITVESSGSHPVGGMMNQTIVVEAKPMEPMEPKEPARTVPKLPSQRKRYATTKPGSNSSQK